MCKHCAIFRKNSNPQNLVFSGILEPILCRYQGITIVSQPLAYLSISLSFIHLLDTFIHSLFSVDYLLCCGDPEAETNLQEF
jgi:hypothetical protein